MSFTCPQCGMTSHNPNDEREGYCGNCCAFTGTPAMPESAARLLAALVDIEDQALEVARAGGCKCSSAYPGTDRDYPLARYSKESYGKPYNQIRWEIVHESGCPMEGQRGIGYASDPKCGELSPESGKPCYLARGHAMAHEASLGPASIASWAHTDAKEDVNAGD